MIASARLVSEPDRLTNASFDDASLITDTVILPEGKLSIPRLFRLNLNSPVSSDTKSVTNANWLPSHSSSPSPASEIQITEASEVLPAYGTSGLRSGSNDTAVSKPSKSSENTTLPSPSKTIKSSIITPAPPDSVAEFPANLNCTVLTPSAMASKFSASDWKVAATC